MGNRRWTAEETEYLTENWGSVAVLSIAEHLGRSTQAVILRHNRLKLGPFLQSGDYVTLNQLLLVLTGKTVNSYIKTSWIQERGLPVHYRRNNACRFCVVKIDEFWKWAEKNRSFIDFSKLETLALGKEPAWVKEQRKKDFSAFSLQCKAPWTALV